MRKAGKSELLCTTVYHTNDKYQKASSSTEQEIDVTIIIQQTSRSVMGKPMNEADVL
jgi:hypothetical protein